MSPLPSLVLLCKKPALHHGKQRLASSIGAEQALVFAELFLRCALEDLEQWSGHVIISPASQQDNLWAQSLLSRSVTIVAQPAGNLGERINQLDQQLRQQGHQQLIYMGSDAPSLMPEHYLQAARLLIKHDIALTPAIDGGVTLMANRVPWPDMQLLPWSTAQLGSALARLCQTNQLSVAQGDVTSDVDTLIDLQQLRAKLVDDKRPARQVLAQQLISFLNHFNH
ncbi:DUF2064 domain-containing protein [Psychrobium sp. 1_MG-2023]|uniref:TIGR04282 family arsenosugar biosynthesis glycosyltransferase n=1 Tax=Psychrobium sp. 1_MG-2023 TaxID=3062624 RepID=UPI002733091D|nr:DUF2064 domain-containing protein [Psychrobium sp. 1_MG-2023]MDP2560064.1 DUF2064 domain-containing protein [Psychrobium sp. 1_MG-2023]